jgi:integrase
VFDAGKDSDGKRVQITKQGFSTKREAEDDLRGAVGKQGRVVPGRGNRLSFGLFFQQWLENRSAAHWGKKTAEENRKRAQYALRTLGNVRLQELTSSQIERSLYALLAQGGRKTPSHPVGRPLSPKTVREIGALIRQALKKAVAQKLISDNPMQDVELPPAHDEEVELLQPDEFEKYLDRVQGTRYYALSVFAAASGCRRGEILALTRSDVDLTTGLVTVSKSLSETKESVEVKVTKSRRTRHVRISRSTIEVLKDHWRRIDDERILFGRLYTEKNLAFPTPNGTYYVPSQVTARISEFMKKAGVNATLHSLRHLHASLMLSHNVPITVVSKRLGHANSQITLDIYAHAMKKDGSAAAELWEEATKGMIERTRKSTTSRRAESGSNVRNCEVLELPKASNN